MACTVQLKYYDSRSGEEVASTYIVASYLYINDVVADGETTQENTSLTFKHSATLPGSGGYAFSTWRFSEDGGENLLSSSDEELTIDATDKAYLIVRCVLDPQPCTITYNYNNPSSVGDYVQTVLFADDTTELIQSPAYNGYIFKSWRIGSEDYAGGSVFTPESLAITANATWIALEDDDDLLPAAEITYEDEDENETGTDVVAKGTTTKLKTTSKSNSSWTISGGGSSGTSKKSGSSFTPNSSEKYTAKETVHARTFYVRFNTNNSAIQGLPAYRVQAIEEGSSVTFPSCADKSQTLKFRSWSCNGDVYAAGSTMDVYKNCTATANYSEDKTIEVKFSIDTTKGLIDKTRMNVTVGGVYGELANVSDVAEWNEFIGWYTTSAQSGGVLILSSSTVLETKSHTLYARILKKATFYLYPNGGTISGSSVRTVRYQSNYDSGFVDDWPIPDRTGFTSDGWDGWWTSGALTGGTQATSALVAIGGKESHYYARWKPKVSYVSETGQSFPDTYETIGLNYANLPTATPPANKTFIGWYTEQSSGSKVTGNTPVVAVQTRTLYAHFANVSQTVHFDANGSTYELEDMTYEYPGTYTAFPEAVKDGNTFVGWFTLASGGEQVKQGDAVTNASERTLYAHYNLQQTVHFYGHKFMLMGGDSDAFVVNLKYDKGGKYDLWPQPNFGSNPNYTGHWELVGFFTYEEGGEEVKSGDTVTSDNERALHARYRKNDEQITVNFSPNSLTTRQSQNDARRSVSTSRDAGASLTRTSQSVFEGEPVRDLPNGTREGYSLVGFSTNSAGPVNVDSTYVPTEETTLYAQWKEKILLYYKRGTDEQ